MKLSELLRNNGSDKCIHHSYADVYDEVLTPYKHSAKNILELGILEGASCRAYREFFPNATIHGIDNESNRLLQGDRFKSYHMDTKNRNEFVELSKTLPLMDVIIDDGGHVPVEQCWALCVLWKCLKSGGVYIVEDIYNPDILQIFDAFHNFTPYNLRHVKNKDDDIIAVIRKD